MKKISKGFYLFSIFGGFIGSFLLSLATSMVMEVLLNPSMLFIAAATSIGGFVFAIYGLVMLFVLLHKMWKSIQSDHSRTTPAKAVGFLFIPFFNFYWIFQAFWGWTKDYNKYALAQNITGQKMSESIALFLCICGLASILPTVGYLAAIAFFVLMFMFLNKSIDGVNAIIKSKS